MTWRILQGDVRAVLPTLPDASVHCVVTSPPYWGLRDYGVEGQIGQEATPEAFVATMVDAFREVRRVLRKDGTLWLNLGDSYARSGGTQAGGNRELMHMGDVQRRCLKPPAGLKHKDLVGIPWMVAFALRADGWYLRSEIIWAKTNPMPESVTDRPTKSHEQLFLLSKSPNYHYDASAISEPSIGTTHHDRTGGRFAAPGQAAHTGTRNADDVGDRRNKRSVWTIATTPFGEAHFATFPPALVEPCILAGCPAGGTVLDPFSGSGTTGMVALRHQRNYIGIELNPEYVEMSRRRIVGDAPLLNAEAVP